MDKKNNQQQIGQIQKDLNYNLLKLKNFQDSLKAWKEDIDDKFQFFNSFLAAISALAAFIFFSFEKYTPYNLNFIIISLMILFNYVFLKLAFSVYLKNTINTYYILMNESKSKIIFLSNKVESFQFSYEQNIENEKLLSQLDELKDDFQELNKSIADISEPLEKQSPKIAKQIKSLNESTVSLVLILALFINILLVLWLLKAEDLSNFIDSVKYWSNEINVIFIKNIFNK